MIRTILAAVSVLLIVSGNVSAQAPVRLRWQTGQVLLYKVEQAIAITEIAGEKKVETTIKMNNTKRWQVLSVDANGVATIQHSLVALRQEMIAADGKTLLFDSANPDNSTPELKEELSKFIGPPLAVLRVDALGRVLEVKESKFGPASRYETELPFVGVLPVEALAIGKTWDRSYNLTLDSQGAGEKYAAVQHYVCKSMTERCRGSDGDNRIETAAGSDRRSCAAASDAAGRRDRLRPDGRPTARGRAEDRQGTQGVPGRRQQYSCRRFVCRTVCGRSVNIVSTRRTAGILAGPCRHECRRYGVLKPCLSRNRQALLP